eukprot:1347883-Pleurochrysis_carterae.AAC.1
MDIRQQWATFVNASPSLFDEKAMAWRNMLRNLEQFIHERKGEQKPMFSSDDALERRLAHWVYNQQSNYAKSAEMMENVHIRQEWAAFLEKHDVLFGEYSSAFSVLLRDFDDIMKELSQFS